jgi:hypothetical protein
MDGWTGLLPTLQTLTIRKTQFVFRHQKIAFLFCKRLIEKRLKIGLSTYKIIISSIKMKYE